MTNTRLRLFSNMVIIYMLLALSWWSVLLFKKSHETLVAKTELLKITSHFSNNQNDLFLSKQYIELQKEYERQKKMILGEGFVFGISLIIGIWLINRSYKKEIDATTQQRNFLLSITHELKSPIASIQLVLETFLKRNLNKEQQEKLGNSALQETARLNHLVNNLLFAAKVETAYQLFKEEINLMQLFNEIISKLQTKYPAAEFQLEELSPLNNIHADKLGISSIAHNLLENAVKYSKKTEAVKIKIEISQHNNSVQLKIIDNGIGISDKEKKHIFEKFYRVGNEDTRKTKGTGLGLYIVKRIVDAHAGKITIEDNQPTGSIFIINIPINS